MRRGRASRVVALAGLGDARSGELAGGGSYADFEDLWTGLLDGVGLRARSARRSTTTTCCSSTTYPRPTWGGDRPFELTARAWAATGSDVAGKRDRYRVDLSQASWVDRVVRHAVAAGLPAEKGFVREKCSVVRRS